MAEKKLGKLVPFTKPQTFKYLRISLNHNVKDLYKTKKKEI